MAQGGVGVLPLIARLGRGSRDGDSPDEGDIGTVMESPGVPHHGVARNRTAFAVLAISSVCPYSQLRVRRHAHDHHYVYDDTNATPTPPS